MTAIDAGWKYRFRVTTNDQNRSPTFYGVTPASILATPIGNPGLTVYTAGNIATVSVDDFVRVNASLTGVASLTSRSNHLWRFDGVGAVSGLAFLSRFRHLTSGNLLVQQHRLYVWNDTTSAWVLLDQITSAADPRTMSGSPGAPLNDYVNGLGEIFVLLWDFEGVFQLGGACLHADTLVTLEGGAQIKARDVQFADMLVGPNGPIKVDETTYHHPALTKMIRVTVSSGRSYYVTEDHWCPAGETWLEAKDLEVGDEVPDIDRNFHTITGIQAVEEVCEVVDINVTNPPLEVATYEIAGGLLTCNMAGM